jgi:hypothetical protein
MSGTYHPLIVERSVVELFHPQNRNKSVEGCLCLASRLVNAVIIVHQEAMEVADRPHACNVLCRLPTVSADPSLSPTSQAKPDVSTTVLLFVFWWT